MKRYILILFVLAFISCENSNEAQVDELKKEVWQLKNEIKALKSSKDYSLAPTENFNRFLEKFMTDSLFQIERTAFPLTYIYLDFDSPNLQTDTTFLQKENWRHQWFYFNDFSYIPRFYDNYQMELRNTSQRLLHFKGIETGTNSKYYFEFQNNKWLLIWIENFST